MYSTNMITVMCKIRLVICTASIFIWLHTAHTVDKVTGAHSLSMKRSTSFDIFHNNRNSVVFVILIYKFFLVSVFMFRSNYFYGNLNVAMERLFSDLSERYRKISPLKMSNSASSNISTGQQEGIFPSLIQWRKYPIYERGTLYFNPESVPPDCDIQPDHLITRQISVTPLHGSIMLLSC